MSGYFDFDPKALATALATQRALSPLAVMPLDTLDSEKPSSGFDALSSSSSFSTHQRSAHSSPILPQHVTHGASKRFDGLPRSRSPPLSAYTWFRVRRLLSRPLVWVIVILLTISTWYTRGVNRDLQASNVQSRLKELFPPEITKKLQFFPASHRRIHYVGRWTTAPNRLRIDGAFPGVYFNLNITNTSSLVLSLSNAKAKATLPTDPPDHELNSQEIHQGGQYAFSVAARLRVSAPPISLLALVDQEEFVVLPNATGLVGVRMKDLDPRKYHTIRVIAPMTDNGGSGVVQMDGLWLDKGGRLLPVEGSIADTVHDEMEDFDAESVEMGKTHRIGLSRLLRGYGGQNTALKKQGTDTEEEDEAEAQGLFRRRKKLVEIITDDPVHANGRKMNQNRGAADGLLAGVMGWEYLLGEMFSVDHVSIGVDGMCLLQNCVNGTGSPSGLGDVFFRSGPVDSPHFNHPWPFQSYAPDVLIFNMGASDYYSMTNYGGSYNKTGGELFNQFEDTYVSLIKAIRAIAYPSHPATIEMLRLGIEGYTEDNTPATIPIFIMRPFGGELQHASQGAVNRLRAEGDRGVFWLDTSGWLDFEGVETNTPDVFQDDGVFPPRWHLTERGNQKVAIYLHMHVCRYLAGTDENCAFLPPEVYQGSVFDPSVATFERYIENEKERQMKEMFWQDEDEL